MDSAWSRVASLGSVDPQYPLLARAGEDEIAVCRVGDQVFATDNICSHAFARLSDGEMNGYEIVCPLHGGTFDVRTGEPVEPPCSEPIRVFPTKVEQGEIFVNLHVSADRIV